MNKTLLEVKNLRTYFSLEEGILKAVDDVSFKLEENKTLGLVGESGCGKSVTAQSIMGLISKPGEVTGEINYFGIKKNIDLIKIIDNENLLC